MFNNRAVIRAKEKGEVRRLEVKQEIVVITLPPG